jgi:hypothetical protein
LTLVDGDAGVTAFFIHVFRFRVHQAELGFLVSFGVRQRALGLAEVVWEHLCIGVLPVTFRVRERRGS